MIWLTNVQCIGSERFLTNCTANFNATGSCTHLHDAGVRCSSGLWTNNLLAEMFHIYYNNAI